MITNITRKTIIAESETYCISPLSKMKGLMFSRRKVRAVRESGGKIGYDFCLVLVFKKPMRISLHMAFVFYPIDVLFVGMDYRVVDIKQGFRPFSLYTSTEKAVYAIELPVGTVKNTCTKIGDALHFETAPSGSGTRLLR